MYILLRRDSDSRGQKNDATMLPSSSHVQELLFPLGHTAQVGSRGAGEARLGEGRTALAQREVELRREVRGGGLVFTAQAALRLPSRGLELGAP